MAAQGKKKQKMKGTKMALTDFLSDEKGGNAGPVSSYGKVDWAAEMESMSHDMDDVGDTEYSMKPMIDRSRLPTAPKASRGPDVDMSKIPSNPPFTAFIGNLPYEASEAGIEDFFRKLNVVNVRLPNDRGRLRGFGYVEFADRQSLIDALAMNEETMGGRQIRVDLAGQNQQNDRGGMGGDRRDNDGPDRTDSDWRRREPSSQQNNDADRSSGPGRWSSNRDDRGPSRGGYDNDRSGYDDRGPSRGGYNRYDDGPRDRYGDRGPSRGYDDRGSSRGYDDRGPSRGYDDRGPSRGYDDRGPSRGFDRYDDRGGRDGGGRGRGGYGRYDDDRGRGDYGHDRDGGRRGYGSGYRRDERGYDDRYGGRSERGYSQESSQEGPRERPRLNLQPRTKPLEEVKPAEVKAAQPPESRSASIFGSAKPVDTAAREREIEKRLKKQEEETRREVEEKENRNYHNNSASQSGPGRSRHDSSEKSEGRQRRLSSGSSNKGRPGPPPITSPSRSRRDSEISNNSTEVFSGGEEGKETPKSPVSPAQREEVKLVPAPPPPVNVWEKRKSSGPSPNTTPPSKEPQRSETKSAAPPQTEAAPPATNAWGRGRPTEARQAESAPKENAWAKRAHDRSRDQNTREHRGPAGRGESSGRGRGGAWGGRGGRPHMKEKAIPKSVDEMPKMENKSSKDWSDKNMFSGLIEDEDDE